MNRDNIDALSKAIGMFRPEDVKRILEALVRIQDPADEEELDDMENGDDVDNSEEASETADTDKAAGTDPSGTAGEPGKRGFKSHGTDQREDAGDLRQASERRHGYKFQIGNQFYDQEWDHFLKFDSVQDATRAALEEKSKGKGRTAGRETDRYVGRQQKSRMRWIVSWPRV